MWVAESYKGPQSDLVSLPEVFQEASQKALDADLSSSSLRPEETMVITFPGLVQNLLNLLPLSSPIAAPGFSP